MLRWALRFFLIRVLPGRVILLMSLADLFFLIRSLRRRARPLFSGDGGTAETGRPGRASGVDQAAPRPRRG